MKIELESFNVSIVGDSGTGLMNEVIEVVQAHINKLTEDLQDSLVKRPD